MEMKKACSKATLFVDKMYKWGIDFGYFEAK
jgi:hypothetical protein